MKIQSPLRGQLSTQFHESCARCIAGASKVLFLLFVASIFASSASAQNSGKSGNTYPNGVEGVQAATLPPPGTYIRWYTFNYDANTVNDNDGNALPVGLRVNSIATIPRLIWVAPQKTLGGNIAVSVLVPIVYADVKVNAANYHQHTAHIGDLDFTTLLTWHGKRYDLAAGSDWILPTGAWDATSQVKPGSDEYTIMPDFGVTYYFDAKKKWNASVLSRFEYHTDKRDQNIHMGDDFHFEWGAARALNEHGVQLGAAGYAQWKVTDDSGKDVTWMRTAHDRVFSAGPELDMPLPKTHFYMNMRGEVEFGERSRTAGEFLCLILTRRF